MKLPPLDILPAAAQVLPTVIQNCPKISPKPPILCLISVFSMRTALLHPLRRLAFPEIGQKGQIAFASQGSLRSFSDHHVAPEDLSFKKNPKNIPVGGENLYRRVGGPGYPMMFEVKYDRPSWQPLWEDEHKVMPRDTFGVPAHIPPEVSTKIKHVYYVPPQFYPFLKKLGDDTPALKPYTEKLIKGEMTYYDYEEMFYKFAKPLKIHRKLIPLPYRTAAEMEKSKEIDWEGKWLTYRQTVLADYNSHMYLREYLYGAAMGIFLAYLWLDAHKQYRIDMKLFYLEAPEHKINWVKPRGDLV